MPTHKTSKARKKSVRQRAKRVWQKPPFHIGLARAFSKSFYYTAQHDGIEHAGYLAFVGMLSIFPFLIVLMAAAGAMDLTRVSDELISILTSHLPTSVMTALTPRIKEIASGPPKGLLPLSVIAMVWTASSSVEALRTILNRVYQVHNPPAYIWRRLLSIFQFLVFVVALFIAASLLLFIPAMLTMIERSDIWRYLAQYWHISPRLSPLWDNVRVVIGWMLLTGSIAASYYVIPNIRQRWRSVLPGTVIVLIGGWGCIQLLVFYIKSFNQVNIIYGSLGGVVVWLLFLFFLGVVYIFGAEFNYFYAREMKGRRFEMKVPASTSAPTQDDVTGNNIL